MSGRSTTDWYKEKEAASPLKLISTVDVKKLQTITIYGYDRPSTEADRRERREKVYMHNCENVETILACVTAFEGLVSTLHLEHGSLFAEFRKTLGMGVQPAWESVIGSPQDTPRTTNNFWNRVHRFISQYTKPRSFENLQEFLAICCKPMNVSPQQMYNRMALMNNLSTWLAKRDGTQPFEEEKYTADQLKVFWSRSMPEQWQSKWRDAHPGPTGDYDNHSFADLLAFFDSCNDAERRRQAEARRRDMNSVDRRLVPGRGGRGRGQRLPPPRGPGLIQTHQQRVWYRSMRQMNPQRSPFGRGWMRGRTQIYPGRVYQPGSPRPYPAGGRANGQGRGRGRGGQAPSATFSGNESNTGGYDNRYAQGQYYMAGPPQEQYSYGNEAFYADDAGAQAQPEHMLSNQEELFYHENAGQVGQDTGQVDHSYTGQGGYGNEPDQVGGVSSSQGGEAAYYQGDDTAYDQSGDDPNEQYYFQQALDGQYETYDY